MGSRAAEVTVGRARDRLLEEASTGAGKRAEVAEERTKAVFEQRRHAADDRIKSQHGLEIRRVLSGYLLRRQRDEDRHARAHAFHGSTIADQPEYPGST